MKIFLNKKNISEKTNIELNKIAIKNRKIFTKIISDLYKNNQNNLDWFVSLPLSRATSNSNFFFDFCKIIYVKNLFESNHNITEIIVDSKPLEDIFKKLAINKITNISRVQKIFPLDLWYIKIILYFFYQTYFKLIQLFICKLTQKNKINIKKIPLILIETFVSSNFIKQDRYYTGLWKKISKKNKRFIFFIPFIIMTKLSEMRKLYISIRNSEENYLIKEDYLSIFDIIYASSYCIRIFFLKYKPLIYDKIDLTPLVRNELISHRGCYLAIEGILNYLFFKKLKKNDIHLKLVINWWENQACDKGFNFGLHKFYPQTKVKGYLGYAPRELEIQVYPTHYEIFYNIVPKNILVLGDGFIKKLKFFYNHPNIESAPAFRFQHLWKNNKKSINQSYFTILIPLPVLYSDSLSILKKINNLNLNKINKKIRYWIVFHPGMQKKEKRNIINLYLNKKMVINNKKTENLLRHSNIVCTSHSSVALEAISLNIPAIIINKKSGINFNPIPEEIPKTMFRISNNLKEINSSIEYFYFNKNEKINDLFKLSKEIKKRYFEKINQRNIIKFLDID